MHAAAVPGVAALLLLGAAGPALAAELPLPVPARAPLLDVGLTQDRIRTSLLPAGATSSDTETVEVAVSGEGVPTDVEVEQHLRLTGRGDYRVVERGPARRARALGDSNPPTVKLGAVLYAGFVPPGGRELAARLTLDAALEAARLPLTLALDFQPDGQPVPQPLPVGGAVPGPGVVRLTLTAVSAADVTLPVGDVPAAVLAGPLDVLRAAAADPGPRPPLPGEQGIPLVLPAAGPVGAALTRAIAPLRVDATLRLLDAAGAPVPGTTISGPATSGVPGGGRLEGTLQAAADFALRVPGKGRLALDLTAVPALAPRDLAPPAGSATWAAWAATARAPAERADALARLVTALAQAGRVRDVSPYLTTDLQGEALTTFRFRLAPPPADVVAPAGTLRARTGALVLTGAALLLGLLNIELLRRRL